MWNNNLIKWWLYCFWIISDNTVQDWRQPFLNFCTRSFCDIWYINVFFYLITATAAYVDKSQQRPAYNAWDIIMPKRVYKHRCTLFSFTLVIQWHSCPILSRDRAQNRQLDVHHIRTSNLTSILRAVIKHFHISENLKTFGPTRWSDSGPLDL